MDIRGGQIKAIKDKSGNTIADRTDMENAQKKWNTEGKTAPQPVFGDKRLPSQKPTTPKPKLEKSISVSKLKTLVGTKGYEGYSLDEIIEYYTSNGYNINK